MKKMFMMILVFLSYFISGATQVYDLPDLMSPHTMTIDGRDIYIAAKSQVYVYEYPDKFKAVFGKKGSEGLRAGSDIFENTGSDLSYKKLRIYNR